MRLLGHEPITPPPPGGLIWGEGRCVLLLVRNNHCRLITFTACCAFIAELWDEEGASERAVERNHKFTHQGDKNIWITTLLSVACTAPSPLVSSVPAHPSPLCSVWALEVVSRGLCPVHWSWKKSVLCLVMEQDVSASQEWWGLGEQGEQRAGPSPGGDQQWGSQSGFYVSADGCVFGNYPPLHEHSFPGEIPNPTGPRKSAQDTVNKD